MACLDEQKEEHLLFLDFSTLFPLEPEGMGGWFTHEVFPHKRSEVFKGKRSHKCGADITLIIPAGGYVSR